MNLQQTFSKILGREVTEDEAKDLASTQFGMLADYLRRNPPTRETEVMPNDINLVETRSKPYLKDRYDDDEISNDENIDFFSILLEQYVHFVSNTPENKFALTTKKLFDLADFHEFQNASEKLFLTEKLKANNFNIKKTAIEIGVVRAHAYNLIDKYDIEIKRGAIKD